MMNPFSTGYRFILGYIETRRFVSLKEAIHRLRKEGKIEEEKKLILIANPVIRTMERMQSRMLRPAMPQTLLHRKTQGQTVRLQGTLTVD